MDMASSRGAECPLLDLKLEPLDSNWSCHLIIRMLGTGTSTTTYYMGGGFHFVPERITTTGT